MVLLDVSEYASQHSTLPYTGGNVWVPIVVGVLLLVIAGVVWCCIALGAVTDRRDGR